MNDRYAETELLNELIHIQAKIQTCFEQKKWAEVGVLDQFCGEVLERVNEFAKTGASIMLKLQVDSLIKSYRELLTQSIFEQEALEREEDSLRNQQEFTDLVKKEIGPQLSLQ